MILKRYIWFENITFEKYLRMYIWSKNIARKYSWLNCKSDKKMKFKKKINNKKKDKKKKKLIKIYRISGEGGRNYFSKKKNIFKVCSGGGNMGYKNIMIEL